MMAILCAAALGGVAVLADAGAGDFVAPEIGFLEVGVVCAQDSGVTQDAPDTVAGTTHVIENSPPFVGPGPRVPAVLGIGFGVRAGMAGDIGQDGVRMTVTHPALGGAGNGATAQSFVTRIGSELAPGLTFYQFDYAYELALGDWTMTAQVGDTILFRVTFTVVPPAAVPELAGICGYQDLLS